jgi:fatty-acyl-CoA synthase
MPANADLEYNLIHRFNVGDALRRSAARAPEKRAIHFQGRELTYSALDGLTNRMARLFVSSGIGRGDAVAIFGMNSPEYVAAFFACARIGAILVPINLMFTADDVDYALQKTRVKALLVEPVFLPKVTRGPALCWVMDESFPAKLSEHDSEPVEHFVDNEDPLLMIFTSGTTARPKGVVVTHLNFYANLLTNYAEFGLDRARRHLIALPLFHVGGLVTMFGCYASGCDSVLLSLPKPEPILQAITFHKINTAGLPATVWVGLLQVPGVEAADLSSLTRPIVFQYLPTPVFQRWRQLAPNADWVNCWGQTETTALGSSTPPDELGRMLSAPDPIGMQHFSLELRIVDEAMNDVEPGKPGEMVVRGPSVTPGYFEDAPANEALWRGGWHHTGDVAYRDEHGCLYFLDRKKDMIKSGGENVSSQEVEEAIAQHPAVAEVAVIGLPDPYWIEKVVACVVPLPDTQPTEDELMAYARSRLAGYKVPKQIHVMAEFPKNPSGKVLKRVLRQRLVPDEKDANGASVPAEVTARGGAAR